MCATLVGSNVEPLGVVEENGTEAREAPHKNVGQRHGDVHAGAFLSHRQPVCAKAETRLFFSHKGVKNAPDAKLIGDGFVYSLPHHPRRRTRDDDDEDDFGKEDSAWFLFFIVQRTRRDAPRGEREDEPNFFRLQARKRASVSSRNRTRRRTSIHAVQIQMKMK